jgi:hypothetical protein
MVRKPGEVIIGHAPIRTQLTWCKKLGVPWAIFAHLGSEIVEAVDLMPLAMAHAGRLEKFGA